MLLPKLNQIRTIQPLVTPEQLNRLHPLDCKSESEIDHTREAIIDILNGDDSRMIAIVGPCSMDESKLKDGTPAVVRFAEKLDGIRETPLIKENLLTIMRVPPAKPRTDLGWSGLDETDPIEAHWLMREIVDMAMPVAMEVMDRDQIARYGGMLALAWVGARNNKDTILRRTLSAFPELPLLCKNDDHGDIMAAALALDTIAAPQNNVRITMPNGSTGIMPKTNGNPNGGLLWRGGSDMPTPQGFSHGLHETAKRGIPYGVDCSHGSAQSFDPGGQFKKTVEGQHASFDRLISHIDANDLASQPVAVMIEAHLLSGADPSGEVAGLSRTDPCVSIDKLGEMMIRLATCAASQRTQTLTPVC